MESFPFLHVCMFVCLLPCTVRVSQNSMPIFITSFFLLLFSCDAQETCSQKFVSGNSKRFLKSFFISWQLLQVFLCFCWSPSIRTHSKITQVSEPGTLSATWHLYFQLYLCLSLQEIFCLFCFSPWGNMLDKIGHELKMCCFVFCFWTRRAVVKEVVGKKNSQTMAHS